MLIVFPFVVREKEREGEMTKKNKSHLTMIVNKTVSNTSTCIVCLKKSCFFIMVAVVVVIFLLKIKFKIVKLTIN